MILLAQQLLLYQIKFHLSQLYVLAVAVLEKVEETLLAVAVEHFLM
jgi:hypothetical protein